MDDNRDDTIQAAEETDVTDAIAEATDYINQYCLQLYPATTGDNSCPGLAESHWTRRRASYLALHFLSERRGNPGQYIEDFNRITDELQRVSNLQITIPRVPMSADLTPGMSNLVVDPRYESDTIRVDAATLVGPTYADQSLDQSGITNNPIW